MLADTVTPVSIYLKVRDRFQNSIMLESSDYHGNEDSFSYICCEPIAWFKLANETVERHWPNGTTEQIEVSQSNGVVPLLTEFAQSFDTSLNASGQAANFKFITNGLFGYTAYDAVRYFEDLSLDTQKPGQDLPDMYYAVYRYIIAVDHFRNALYIFEHNYGQATGQGISNIIDLIKNKNVPSYSFETAGPESSNFTDAEFLDIVKKGRDHCNRGDVFQIVLSRRFERPFQGDEFNVYRSLRSINPSPYLFYFDYGTFKIFGSSPEAQILIKGQEASIFPIAGTFRRTGSDEADAELAKKLYDDPKENSEHVMLVDLARNDLSRHGNEVTVNTFKEIQYFSHVIHLVSKVTGQLGPEVSPYQMVADTFPAGTLSGAPKHMAMQLIDKYEKHRRDYYGGAIGYLGFNGDFNHAIMIRSFLSKNNVLHYQAGAGVVAKSVDENERQEVFNKLAALKQAVDDASEIN